MIEGSAVVVGLAEVLLDGVVVSVEVDQGNRAVHLGAGTQLGQGDAVVAAHGNGNNTLLKEGQHALGDQVEGLLDVAGNRTQIAVIDTGALVENTHLQRTAVGLRSQAGQLTDGGRSQTGAYTIGSTGVIGQANHGEIHVVQDFGVLDVLHAHKGFDARETRRLQRILCFVMLFQENSSFLNFIFRALPHVTAQLNMPLLNCERSLPGSFS